MQRGGKTNQMGHTLWTFMTHHVQPELCGVAALAEMVIFDVFKTGLPLLELIRCAAAGCVHSGVLAADPACQLMPHCAQYMFHPEGINKGPVRGTASSSWEWAYHGTCRHVTCWHHRGLCIAAMMVSHQCQCASSHAPSCRQDDKRVRQIHLLWRDRGSCLGLMA
jgi:hypothetical protein